MSLKNMVRYKSLLCLQIAVSQKSSKQKKVLGHLKGKVLGHSNKSILEECSIPHKQFIQSLRKNAGQQETSQPLLQKSSESEYRDGRRETYAVPITIVCSLHNTFKMADG